jgi:3-keto-disaccharide hydrolase
MRFSRLLPAVLLALAALGFASRPTAARADDTKEFLDPANWEGLPQYWKVEGTSVTGHAEKDPGFNTFLCSKKPYTDFELSFRVRLKDGKGNSGVQVRSKVEDPKKYVVAGPQCDIGQQFWGSLYGERVGGMMQACPKDFVKKAVKPTDFNDYHVVVKGTHVTIKVNGETAVDADFPALPNKQPTPAAGVIAFQLHAGGPMTVEFTDVKFTDLSKKK